MLMEGPEFSILNLNVLSSGLKGPVSKEGFENALYMMDIGHNDMVGVAHTPSDQWDKKIAKIVGEVGKAISVRQITPFQKPQFVKFQSVHTRQRSVSWPSSDSVRQWREEVLDPRHRRPGLPAGVGGAGEGRARRERLPRRRQPGGQGVQQEAEPALRRDAVPPQGRHRRVHRHVRHQVRLRRQPHQIRYEILLVQAFRKKKEFQ